MIMKLILLSGLSMMADPLSAYQLPFMLQPSGAFTSRNRDGVTPRVAIIGAGIAGASTAHHLHQLARLHQKLDIVVFEADAELGGRIRSAHVFDMPWWNVEVGATAFGEDDWCLKEAMEEVGLKPAIRVPPIENIGVWDGGSMLVTYPNIYGPLNTDLPQSLKWNWRYGTSLRKVRDVVHDLADKFSSFTIFQPFLRLSEKVFESFQLQEIMGPGTSMLAERGINPRLVDEVIQAGTRYRHARDIDRLNGLSTMLALRPAQDVAVEGGNVRLPHRMLKIAEAQVYVNTRVTRIAASDTRRWRLHVETLDNPFANDCPSLNNDFDIVVLTAPFASSNILIDSPITTSGLNGSARPYIARHVTLFSTRQRLSPLYFNQQQDYIVPDMILTSPANRTSHRTNDIFSISAVARVPPKDDMCGMDELENVYKIVSSEEVSKEELARLVDHHSTEDPSDSPVVSSHNVYDEASWHESIGITWLHRHTWPHAYPDFNPKDPILDDIEIAPDLYYTAAAEQILSTMEMSCRMGKNVAKHLFYEKWADDAYP